MQKKKKNYLPKLRKEGRFLTHIRLNLRLLVCKLWSFSIGLDGLQFISLQKYPCNTSNAYSTSNALQPFLLILL